MRHICLWTIRIRKEVNQMKFELQVSITENDYFEFNTFHALKSPYGQKNIKNSRIVLAVFGAIVVFLFLMILGFTKRAILFSIPLIALLALMEIFWKQFIAFNLKIALKQLKKGGKMAYSPFANIEFFEEYFVETTDEDKTERKYSSIERTSIVEGRYVYMHINNLAAIIIPIGCFSSSKQYNEFIEFLRQKNEKIDFYK